MDSGDFFIGPAVVVDDRLGEPHEGMNTVVEQLQDAGLPVLTRTQLPPPHEVRHWGGFALIILDWELISAGEPGVSLPDDLKAQNAEAVAAFVERLLSELYSPVFILSSRNVEEIEEELATRLQVDSKQVSSRVRIRRKADAVEHLLADLEAWVKNHPAVYAMKSWETGYADARRRMFADFELSSTDWPRILWGASEKDKTNPNFELAEAISRNILHRFEPLVFDEGVLKANAEDDVPASVAAVRSVIHRRAVVPAVSLHDDVVMPGDFFAVEDPDSRDLLINVTPACDLVQRAEEEADIQMTVLRARPLEPTTYSSKSKRDKMRTNPDPTTEVVWVLSEDGRPFCVEFKSWTEASWQECKARRLGRLLDPYIIQLQQRFALHFHRQGVPRLPDEFYDG